MQRGRTLSAATAAHLARLVLEDLVPGDKLPPERVLAEDLVAPLSLQPFDNSQMDGFAIRAADSRTAPGEDGRTPFVVVAPVPAGHVPGPLGPGEAAPVMTGAPLPSGADAVVPVEESLPVGFPAPGTRLRLPAGQPAGRFVRRAGEEALPITSPARNTARKPVPCSVSAPP